jgi:hypothetical protein
MSDLSTKKLGRRDVLKVMIAGAGAITTSSFIPEKWVKPVADFGVSPVHAQASIAGVGTITGVVNYDCSSAPGSSFPDGADVAVVATAFDTTTAANGTYTIANVPAGTYQIKATLPNPPWDAAAFQTVSVTVTAGATVTRDFLIINGSNC